MNIKRHNIKPLLVIFQNGQRIWGSEIDSRKIYHRIGGPAFEYNNGDKEWWIKDKARRNKGPTIDWSGGRNFDV